ncbi:DEAD/DEAH box helicase [Helicobacter sp. MIT 03-1614]|uniref:type I restriction endonuclease subunit R n=1 Tax=Helicobacter sp. MIT 03-1614 TaxID=1548147 RepID=UPI0005138369|nr:DEAD/DEAH box helicase family protein [Helicobacter sp. MIT 03-1614]TLD87174.1 DEAD/DEAH box helicase [Helicobacter sp. MIT 03-1614]
MEQDLKPEQKAREEIDKLLSLAGFELRDFKDYALGDSTPNAARNLAIKEFILENGTKADYMLFVKGKACGVIEAKKFSLSLSGAENQAKNYAYTLPAHIPSFQGMLPFVYVSNASEIYFTDLREPNPRARRIFAFHTPKELLDKLSSNSLRERIQQIPALSSQDSKKLRDCQKDAIEGLEKSLKQNKQRALIQMATGAGKTFTACNFAYRLLSIAKAKRILFLVDRNNLGKQAKKEFDNFSPSADKRHFSEIYNVVHLETNHIPTESKVVITTIQRLYSILRGESEFDSAEEEHSAFENEDKETKEVAYNPQIGIDTFDFIIIDECHRSIYGLWRQVLEYFDAFLIGLSATPSKHTLGFFAQNIVAQYDLEKSILDKVNVGYEIFRIKTQISEQGSIIEANAEFQVPFRDKDTRKIGYESLEEDLEYSKADLDRSVLAPSQIRTILETYRDKVFDLLFPERERSFLAKTLIFAKDDNHAEEIVRLAREVFNADNEFAQKITYNIGNQNPHELINAFRHSKKFRIAVTVDMIATGTDIKPLEVLIFMRDVKSASYYAQMVGRGVRSIHNDDLRAVTPNADCKTRFYVIDAVGVSESQKIDSRPLERKKRLSLKEILQLVRESVAKGEYEKDTLLSLASRLTRLELKLSDEDNTSLQELNFDKSLCTLAKEILTFADSLQALERAEIAHNPLEIFTNDTFCKLLLELVKKSKIYIDEISQDSVLSAEFDTQKAQNLIAQFNEFILQHKDEITALSIIYAQNYKNRHLTYEVIKELAHKLKQDSMDIPSLWNAYKLRDKGKVSKNPSKNLTNLISLVRYALKMDNELQDFAIGANARYNLWRGRCKKKGIAFSPEQEAFLELIKEYIIANGCAEIKDIQEICADLGGIYRAKAIFNDSLPSLVEELSLALVG